jgi:hypothetical protein
MSGFLLIVLTIVIVAPAALVALVVYAIRFKRSRAVKAPASDTPPTTEE